MSAVATSQAHSVVAPSGTARKIAATLVILYALFTALSVVGWRAWRALARGVLA